MALNIDRANEGIDFEETKRLANKINQTMEETISTITLHVEKVREAVDSCWWGKSADKFKEKLDRDTEEITKTLRDLGESISSQLGNISYNYESADEEVANKMD